MLHCEIIYRTTKVNNAPEQLEKKGLTPFAAWINTKAQFQ